MNPTDFNLYDVIVIGAGPAGSSTAFHCAKLGLKTLLIEKQKPGRDKPCGGALSDRCLPLLGKLALDAINCKVEELHVYSPDLKYFQYKKQQGNFVLRKVFDEAMAYDAENAGATLMTETKAFSLAQNRDNSYTVDISIKNCEFQKMTGRFIVLACGLQDNDLIKNIPDKNGNNTRSICPKNEKDYLAICMNSESKISNELLTASPFYFQPKTLGIFFGAVPNGYGWCFTKDDSINVGVGCTASLLSTNNIKEAYDAFIRTLKTKKIIPGDLILTEGRAFPLPFKHTAKETVLGNVILVGDAAGFVSPVTGEGIYYSLKSGQLAALILSEHIKNGTSLDRYQKIWEKEFGNDLDKWGFNLRRFIYQKRTRMELAVHLARADASTRKIVSEMIMGVIKYRETTRKGLLHLPLCLVKALFFKK